MVTRTIDLGDGLKFLSLPEAKNHFGKILTQTPVNQKVTSEEFNALRVLFETYCAKTNWRMPSPPKAFLPIYEKQEGYSTKCFGIEIQDGKTGRFSLDKALSAVAN